MLLRLDDRVDMFSKNIILSYSLEKWGVGALEIVAMDLKARGMYLCHTLSYKGAEFDVVEVQLEDKMMDMYNRAAECISAKVPAVVKLCHQALQEDKCVVIGLQSTGEARTKEAVVDHGYDLVDFISGARELLLKFVEKKFPLPKKPESLLGEDGVKELQRKRRSATTGVSLNGRARKAAKLQDESDTETKINAADPEPESTESGDEFQICEICSSEMERGKSRQCSCRKQLMHPASLVHKRYNEATERKSQILDVVRYLDLPQNPLDVLIDQLGGPDKVAEITGRRHRLIKASNGNNLRYQPRNRKNLAMEMVNMNEKQSFMNGKKLVAIISEAGSAGVSLQADRRALNQRRRVHLTLELPWSADRAIQQFGRTHRSNQASAPQYRLLFSNLGGERRFVSIVAKRLESLGALTQGDRRAGPSLSAYNYNSSYGRRALAKLYWGILKKSPLPVAPSGCSFKKPDTVEDFVVKGKTALESVGIVRDQTYVGDLDLHNVERFLNRLLGLQPEIQNSLFELFLSILDHLVQNAHLKGHLDSGIADIKAKTIQLRELPQKVRIDHLSGAPTFFSTLALDLGFSWEDAFTLFNEKRKDVSAASSTGFYESKRAWSGRRDCLLAFEGSSGMYRIVRPAVGEAVREMPLLDLEKKYRKLSSLEAAHSCWESSSKP